MKVLLYGAGKAGTFLARELGRAGWKVVLRPARRGLPQRLDADVVIVATRDDRIASVAMDLRERISPDAVVLHLAGGLGPQELASVRSSCRGIGVFHPLIALAGSRSGPTLQGACVRIEGDGPAVRMGKRIARAVGLRAIELNELSPSTYHAAAALVAAGAVGLVQAASELLASGGVKRPQAAQMLGPLLRSVSENIIQQGLPQALTGPVRRGDFDRVQAHLAVIDNVTPQHSTLSRSLVQAQLELAFELGEAERHALERLTRLASPGPANERSRRRRIPSR